MNRNTWAIVTATASVLVILILGFRFLGSPGSQRKVQSDLRRVRLLSALAEQVNYKWNSSGKALPGNLDSFPNSMKQDPVSGKTFLYKPKPDNKYELCANFATDNRDEQNTGVNDPNARWLHPKGDFCFEFDASQPVPMAPYY